MGRAVKMNLTERPREKAHMYCRFKFCHLSALVRSGRVKAFPLLSHSTGSLIGEIIYLISTQWVIHWDSHVWLLSLPRADYIEKSKCEMIIFLYEAASQHRDPRTAKKQIKIICADLICCWARAKCEKTEWSHPVQVASCSTPHCPSQQRNITGWI